MPVHEPYLPRVIVKFHDSVTLPYADDIGGVIQSQGIGSWVSLTQNFTGISIRRLARSVDGAALNRLVERAVLADPTYPRRNLLAYFVIECPPHVEPEQVVAQLSHWPNVEAAYVAESPRSPQCTLGYEDPPGVSPPTGGIDARYAQGVTGGDGAGQKFIDIELGWTREHVALSGLGLPAQPLTGAIDDPSRPHGTAVLGIVCGRPSPGFVGIAPGVSYVNVASFLPIGATVPDETMLPDAILAGINNLDFGSVLLLEVQTSIGQLPIETRLECFDFIRLATALGIVVIEAAGNAGTLLDLYEDPPLSGRRVLFRDSSNTGVFKDSGAIMVGAGSNGRLAAIVFTGQGAPPPAHFGNYGSRVDCWAWGDQSALSSISTSSTDTTNFNCFPGTGTSSAAAIVAGAALSVQGMVYAASNSQRRFSPAQLRAILSDRAYGTPATGLDGDKIGVMPDLRKIATEALNVTPDVYMRDYVGDPGQPNGGAFCTSPDIILRNSAVADPRASFLGAGLDDNDMLSDAGALAGQDNFLYVRLRNRGGRDAVGVDVDVYFAPSASLILPANWTWIGRTTVGNIPMGDVLQVSGPITWPKAAVPGTGHYCFVAIAGSASDPAPPLATLSAPTPGVPVPNSWDRFLRFVGSNNNVAWRNFEVVSPDPPTGSAVDAAMVDFEMSGAPDIARPMGLEIVAQLPRGSVIGFGAPLAMIDAWGLRSPFMVIDGNNGIVPANPNGRFLVPDYPLPPQSNIPLTLRIYIPQAFRIQAFTVYARQMYQGREVGRMTWRLQRPRRRSLSDSFIRWVSSFARRSG